MSTTYSKMFVLILIPWHFQCLLLNDLIILEIVARVNMILIPISFCCCAVTVPLKFYILFIMMFLCSVHEYYFIYIPLTKDIGFVGAFQMFFFSYRPLLILKIKVYDLGNL